MKRNVYPRTVVSAGFELKTLRCTGSCKSCNLAAQIEPVQDKKKWIVSGNTANDWLMPFYSCVGHKAADNDCSVDQA
jgi:hypothetical protein